VAAVVGPGGSFKPLAERGFRLLWLGRVSSSAGDVLIPVALAWAVLGLRDSPIAFGVVLATFTVSRVVFSLVGGVVADRFSRRAVMLACDLTRACVEAFTAAMLLTHHMTLPLFVATAALFGAASALFGPAASALVPHTVGAANLQAANALLGMSQNFLNVFGPAVAGALIAATHTTAWVFVVDAATFVISASFIARLPVAGVARVMPPSSFGLELRDGYREVRARGWVSAALVGFSVSNVCLASFLVLGPWIVLHHHPHGGARDWGIVAACGALGALGGGYLSARARPARPLVTGFSCSVLIAVPIAALVRPLPLPLVDISFALGLASIAFCNTLWETALQRRIPDAVLGRIRSYDLLVSFVFMPVGYLAFGPLARAAGYERTLLVTAAVVALTNVAVAVAPAVRNLRAEELPALQAEATA
jgi:MFS family permease